MRTPTLRRYFSHTHVPLSLPPSLPLCSTISLVCSHREWVKQRPQHDKDCSWWCCVTLEILDSTSLNCVTTPSTMSAYGIVACAFISFSVASPWHAATKISHAASKKGTLLDISKSARPSAPGFIWLTVGIEISSISILLITSAEARRFRLQHNTHQE